MLASLLIAILMLAGKTGAYFITGSTAIFSDAMESVIHLFATGFAAFSLWYAERPADREHPYGHRKIAYFSSGFEGGLIMIAALTIIYAAVGDLIRGPEVNRLGIGLLITLVLAGVNLVLGAVLVHVGRRHSSIVLAANGKHVLTDMWTSFGVILGLVGVWTTGLVWLDPAVAILVGVNILWTAGGLIRDSVSGLMESADPTDTQILKEVLDAAVVRGIISGYHQLRHRRVDNQLWVEVHLFFQESLTIFEAHARSHEVEDAIHERFSKEDVILTAHLEPEEHDDAHPGRIREPGDVLGTFGE